MTRVLAHTSRGLRVGVPGGLRAGAYTRPLFGSRKRFLWGRGCIIGVAYGVFRRCLGVFGGIQGVSCVRNGSG